MTEKTKITVVGSGYVGMSLSILLAQHNEVTVLDIDAEKVNKINSKQSTIADREIESFLKTKMLNLKKMCFIPLIMTQKTCNPILKVFF